MIGTVLIASAVVSSCLFAAAARTSSLVSTLLVGYLAFVANLGLTTIALSPFREVTRAGLAIAEVVVVVIAVGIWWARGRPGPPLFGARAAAREIVSDLPTLIFFLFVLALLGYELLLGLTVPPNNGDSLAYHLTKAAAWAQHGGVYWIANAPTVRINAFQPFAEQQLLFLLVATRSTTLIAFPQLLAELAILVAVYGTSRRLGFGPRSAAGGTFLLATFSLLALEATTAQNDLVAASFPVVAACFLLGPGLLEPTLAGVAAGIGLGVKLTTGLAFPILVWLALLRGRRPFLAAVAGGLAGLALLGVWGYALNLSETGHILGVGTGYREDRASPSYPGSVANGFYLMYGLMDLSVLSNRVIYVLEAVGILAGAAAAAWALRRAGARRAIGDGAGVALPFLAPVLVIAGAATLAFGARQLGFPIRGPGGILGPLNDNLNQTYTRFSNEDYSAFGPLGIVALAAASALAFVAYIRRRTDARQLALACAFPCFFILLSASTFWNPFLIRFLAVPIVLTAPLLARLFRGRATTTAYVVVSILTVGLTVAKDQTKPLRSPYGYGPPWDLSQQEALSTNSRPEFASALVGLDTAVPARVCLGAVVGDSDPSFLLYGPHLQRRVFFLQPGDPVLPAVIDHLSYVVLDAGFQSLADMFVADGWKVRPLGGAWLLASRPLAPAERCIP